MLLTAAAAASAAASGWELGNLSTVARKGAPSMVLMMTDDMGWADVAYNGGAAATPNLDAMASGPHSIRFDRFYSGGPVCSPTRASVQTGRTPNRDCIWSANTGHLPAGEFTLFKAAKKAGYATAHFGKWHIGAFSTKVWNDQDGDKTVMSPGTAGADWWYATEHAIPGATGNCACFGSKNCITGHEGGKVVGSCEAKKGNAPGVEVNYFYPDAAGEYDGVSPESERIPGDDSVWLYTKFEAWVKSTVASAKPFVAALHFHPPHKDFIATPELSGPYSLAGLGASAADYLGVITGMDDAVGRVRGLLLAQGVADNTMLWFTSDNGPLDGSPGGAKCDYRSPLRGYKHDLTEGGIRVPGILEWPAGISGNVVTDYPATTMDYLPTFLDAAGVTSDNPGWALDGASLLPLIRGEASRRSAPIGHIFTQDGEWGKGASSPWDAWGPTGSTKAEGKKVSPSSAPSGCSEPPAAAVTQARQASWMVDQLKLYARRAETGDAWQYALFDLSSDAGEDDNIAGQKSAEFKAMCADMWAWAASVYDSQSAETKCLKK